GGGIERAAAGVMGYVVHEADGAGEAAVLVVDAAVHVALVGVLDQAGGLLVGGAAPGLDAQIAVMGDLGQRRRAAALRRAVERTGEEDAAESLKPMQLKRRPQRGRSEGHELGLDAFESGGAAKGVNHMQQEALLGFVVGVAVLGGDEEIADHPLAGFVDEEAVADGVPAADAAAL